MCPFSNLNQDHIQHLSQEEVVKLITIFQPTEEFNFRPVFAIPYVWKVYKFVLAVTWSPCRCCVSQVCGALCLYLTNGKRQRTPCAVNLLKVCCTLLKRAPGCPNCRKEKATRDFFQTPLCWFAVCLGNLMSCKYCRFALPLYLNAVSCSVKISWKRLKSLVLLKM